MNFVLETKACETCAKCKRKCGKEQPRCHRCASRDVDCVYPPARPSAFVLLQDEPAETPASSSSSTSTALQAQDSHATMLGDPTALLCSFSEFDLPLAATTTTITTTTGLTDLINHPSNNKAARGLSCEWFMAPETWMPRFHVHAHIPPPPNTDPQGPPPYGNVVLKRFLKSMRCSLADWVTKGSTYFIHKQLYAFHRPRCVQDAQTALALYLVRTDENEDAVFATLDDRAKQLLEDEGHKTASSLDTFGHLSKVQALLTYLMIGLLDGDIHMRAVAEKRMDTLWLWLEEMVEVVTAASMVCYLEGCDNLRNIASELGLGIKEILAEGQVLQNCVMQEEVQWHAWILAESLRRTWIVGRGLYSTYHALQKGWAKCPGTMMMTARQGMWDAPSSDAWMKEVTQKDVWFIEGTNLDRLFIEAKPEEVDDFTRCCLEVTYGLERMERWGVTVT